MPLSYSSYKGTPQFSMNGLNDYRFLDDFGKAYPLTTNLPVTATSPYNSQASSVGTFSQASPADPFGVAVLSGAVTTNHSGVQIQRDHAAIALALNITYEFSTRVKLSDATNQEFFFGIGTNYGATGPMLNGSASATILSNFDTTHYTDYVGIYKAAGGTLFYGVNQKSGTTAGVSAGFGAATGNYTILGFQIVMDPAVAGKATINFYQDGSLLQSVISTNMPTANLAELIAQLSATASGTISTSVDYIDTRAGR